MAEKFLDLLFTPKVLDAQRHYYGRSHTPLSDGADDPLGQDEIDFIATRDSFYLSSVSESGWPYMQHRGGPPGFLKVIAPDQLAFADYQGNRQMLSTGNLASNDRVCLFLMDYPHRARLKILGHASAVDARDHSALADQIADASMRQITERIFRIKVVSYDWNCPKYITPRYTAAELKEYLAPLQKRITELEAQLGK